MQAVLSFQAHLMLNKQQNLRYIFHLLRKVFVRLSTEDFPCAGKSLGGQNNHPNPTNHHISLCTVH